MVFLPTMNGNIMGKHHGKTFDGPDGTHQAPRQAADVLGGFQLIPSEHPEFDASFPNLLDGIGDSILHFLNSGSKDPPNHGLSIGFKLQIMLWIIGFNPQTHPQVRNNHLRPWYSELLKFIFDGRGTNQLQWFLNNFRHVPWRLSCPPGTQQTQGSQNFSSSVRC